jgi:hypothetical protein
MGRHVLGIARLPRLVRVVADEEIPFDRVVLRGLRMKHRHVVVVGQAIARRILGIAALQRPRIAAGFEQQHAKSTLGQPRGDRATAGARADDDVVGVGGGRGRRRDGRLG